MADLPVTIRRAGEADLPRLNALMHGSRAYAGDYYAILADYFVTAAYLKDHQLFLAEQTGRLLGFYGLIVVGKPELELMFVADAAQGTGVGRLLFDHMKETAANHGVEAVHITSHPPSAGFYERMGAVRVGTAPASGRVTWERPMLLLSIASRRYVPASP